MKTRLALLSILVLVPACGGSPPSPATPEREHGEHHGEHGGHHEEHEKLSPELHAFHEVLAPVWHSDKGPERVTKTCAQAGTLKEKAQATKDAELVAATTALAAECDKPGRAEVEQKLGVVHERFHALAK
jgi:hypothetical protein